MLPGRLTLNLSMELIAASGRERTLRMSQLDLCGLFINTTKCAQSGEGITPSRSAGVSPMNMIDITMSNLDVNSLNLNLYANRKTPNLTHLDSSLDRRRTPKSPQHPTS